MYRAAFAFIAAAVFSDKFRFLFSFWLYLPAEHRYQDLLFLYDMNFDRSRHLMMKLNRYVCVA